MLLIRPERLPIAPFMSRHNEVAHGRGGCNPLLRCASFNPAMTTEAMIRSDVEARIRSGEWAPGYRIPFEHELAANYGCARATVSKALGTLARAGLIERRRKAGSFVARPRAEAAVLAIPDIEEMLRAQGGSYRFSIGVRECVTADTESIFTAGTPLLRIEGVHHGAEGAFVHETRFINLTAVPEAQDAGFTDRAPGGWLLDRVPWSEARHRISAITATAGLARALGMTRGAACLAMDRWTWRDQVAITQVRQIFPGDRYHLVARFLPGST